jgi:hypothetical protein
MDGAQGRISRGVPGLPKVSLGRYRPALPLYRQAATPETTLQAATPVTTLQPAGWAACVRFRLLLSPWIPLAVHLCIVILKGHAKAPLMLHALRAVTTGWPLAGRFVFSITNR